jgi:hypothetical protein
VPIKAPLVTLGAHPPFVPFGRSGAIRGDAGRLSGRASASCVIAPSGRLGSGARRLLFSRRWSLDFLDQAGGAPSPSSTRCTTARRSGRHTARSWTG